MSAEKKCVPESPGVISIDGELHEIESIEEVKPIWFEIKVREDLMTPTVEEWLKEMKEEIAKEMDPMLRTALAILVGSEFL